jgi:hypothetical protein
MIDYWEAIGRLATYKELNDEFLKILPPVGGIPTKNAAGGGEYSAGCGLDIPEQQYNAVQDFFRPVLTEQYLSLMSAGELIWTYSFPRSRGGMTKLEDRIAKAQPKLHGPSTNYYITLGILIVDELFREQVRKEGAGGTTLLRRLATTQARQIINLANDKDFSDCASDFSFEAWDGGCNVRLICWEGHLHPLGMNEYKSWADLSKRVPGSKFAAATAGEKN